MTTTDGMVREALSDHMLEEKPAGGPRRDSQEHIDEVVEHARRFLEAHQPVRA